MRMSLPSRGAWIEMSYIIWFYMQSPRSLPSRGAWIEITKCPIRRWRSRVVAPLAGSVD